MINSVCELTFFSKAEWSVMQQLNSFRFALLSVNAKNVMSSKAETIQTL
jgi:hypothetical protein